jgi:hypothetical protein
MLVVVWGCIEITHSWRLWLPRRQIFAVAVPLLLFIIVRLRVLLDHETFGLSRRAQQRNGQLGKGPQGYNVLGLLRVKSHLTFLLFQVMATDTTVPSDLSFP